MRNFIFWNLSILKFLQLIKVSRYFLLDCAVNSLKLLNDNLRFGGELNVCYYCHLHIFPQSIHSFQSCCG